MLTVKMNVTDIRFDLARDLFDQGGFSRPVRPDQCVDFPRTQIKRYAVTSQKGPELLGDV